MSEHQYYEFQAVDRPLTPQDMSDLGAISTRAKITPTQFQNVYSYGDFKGEPIELMEHYFDAFVYVANWGTNQFILRVPQGLVDAETGRPYAVDGCLDIQPRGEWLKEAQVRAEMLERFRQAAGPRSEARSAGRAVAGLRPAVE